MRIKCGSGYITKSGIWSKEFQTMSKEECEQIIVTLKSLYPDIQVSCVEGFEDKGERVGLEEVLNNEGKMYYCLTDGKWYFYAGDPGYLRQCNTSKDIFTGFFEDSEFIKREL